MIEFIVDDIQDIRLDRFIRREYNYFSQGMLEKTLRAGKIKVNNSKAKSSTRLKKGDIVTFSEKLMIKDGKASKNSYFAPSIISLASKIMGEYLLFSCDNFFVINKPYGLATQGGSKINISVDHALAYINETKKNNYRLVHRLDKETSGILIIAKNLNSCILLGEAFKTRKIEKTYFAIVEGCPQYNEGFIENYIGKEKDENACEIVKETASGKLAKTKYEVITKYDNYSLVKFVPLTGRMHQLRFHSKYLGCPIHGDVKYGGEKFVRMMLHAFEVIIPESVFGIRYNIKSPLDQFFKSYNF